MTQFRLNIHGQERALELTRQGERLHVGVGGAEDPLPNPLPEGEGTRDPLLQGEGTSSPLPNPLPRGEGTSSPLPNALPQGEGTRGPLSTGEGIRAAEVRVVHRDGARLLLEITWPDGTTQRVRLAGARLGDKRQLWIDGRVLTAERVRRRGGGAATEGSLAAAIPAVVSQILVAPGDAVAAGDKLILLESMKMVIPIVAPRAGRVARVLCAVGESVPAGLPLVEMEE